MKLLNHASLAVIATLYSLSSISSTFANEEVKEDRTPARAIRAAMPLDAEDYVDMTPGPRMLAAPFDYREGRRSAMAYYPQQFARHFRGGAGLPGGMDVTLAQMFTGLTRRLGLHAPELVPYFEHLQSYIKSSPMPNQIVLAQMDRALQNNHVTLSDYIMALIHGRCSGNVAPEVRDFVAHTIVGRTFERFLRADPAAGIIGVGNVRLPNKPQNQSNRHSVARHYSSYTEGRLLEPYQMKPALLFGGKFGIMASVEAFYNRFAIIGISKQPYEAHAVLMDSFAAFWHDTAHMEVSEFLDNDLENALAGLHDQHLASGGTTAGFKKAGVAAYLVAEQTRFLQMMNVLNARAFGLWGGSKDYDAYALGQFFLTHEYPTFDGSMISDPDFVRTLQRAVRTHNNNLSRSNMWESDKDLLRTDPVTGRSVLSDQEITLKMLDKYMNEIEKYAPKTKKLNGITAEVSRYEQEITNLSSLANQADKEESLTLAKQNLARAEADHQQTILSMIETKLTNKVGNFYDLKVQFINGQFLKFSEPTLRFKARNYADTRALLGIAGVALPEMPAEVGEGSRDLARQYLRQGIREWKRVMRQFIAQASLLAETTSPHTGRSLAEEFFSARLAGQKQLKAVLAADRHPDRELEDYRPDDLKRIFKGW